MRQSQLFLWSWVGMGVVLVTMFHSGTRAEQIEAKAKSTGPAAVLDAKPADLLRQGLQMAAQGDSEQYQTLTKAALRKDPGFPEAHWHAGHVRGYGDWLTIQEAESFAASDPVLSQYRRMRAAVERNGELELPLARWCADHGQHDLARIHYARLLATAPQDATLAAEAARRGGIGFVQGELLTSEEVAARVAAADQMQKAMEVWRPRLEKWARQLASRSESQRAPAQSQVDAIDDLRVVYAIESYVDDARDWFVLILLDKLSQFPDYDATQALVRFALLAPSDEVRERAVNELKTRPLHDFVPTLLTGLRYPIQTSFRITQDPLTGGSRYQHVFLQDGPQGTQVVETDHRAIPTRQAIPLAGTDTPLASTDSPGELTLAQEKAIDNEMRFAEWMMASQRQIEVNRANQQSEAANARIYALLESTTEESLARQPALWRDWWNNYNEINPLRTISYQYLPTFDVYNAPSFIPATSTDPLNPVRHSCFAPGTVVWTQMGKAAIESIQIGDRVLSQNPNTGELSYQVVILTTAGMPTGQISRITVSGKPIDITTGHVVWVENVGWQMVKELAPSAVLHGIGQSLPVEQQELRDAIPRVHNLVVADTHTFFVGEAGVLVHDITPRRHTHAVVPGLPK